MLYGSAWSLLTVLAGVGIVRGVRYDTYTGERVDADRERYLRTNNILPWCSIDVAPCSDYEGRRLDGSCNNLHRPPLGATLTPYHRMLPSSFSAGYEHRVSTSGSELPGTRQLRTSLIPDGSVASHHYTHLVTHFLVTITGEVTSLHDTVNYVVLTVTCCAGSGEVMSALDPRCQPIPVPRDDPVFRYSNVRCLNLTRAITYQNLGCLSRDLPPERINTSPPMLDLSIIYGNSERAALKGRENEGGRLREDRSGGRDFPPSGSPACLNNERPRETRCHDSPNPGMNSIMGLNLITLWWYRNHNRLARHLQTMNPCWTDERLFRVARDINIAYLQHIFYYELVLLIIGYNYAVKHGILYETDGHVDDYDEKLEPKLSIEYVIATRWFHTMQEGFLNMYDKRGAFYGRRAVVDDTLRSGVLEVNRTIEGLTQGSFRQPAADVDFLVDIDMGSRVLGRLQRASDVVASDIMKSRDVGLPPYNHYRSLCHRPRATQWKHFRDAIDDDKIDIMKMQYESPEDVDLMTGILVERQMPGAMVGPTLACIMADQLIRWRRADRFWYESPGNPSRFTSEQLKEIRKISMARMLCDNGDEVEQVQPYAFLLPGKRNEIRDCHSILTPELSAWKEHQCIEDS